LKIILTVHQFLPDYISGTEILTYETAKELKRQGHTVSVMTGFPSRGNLDDADRFDHYVYDGIPVERFHHSYVPMGTQTNVQEMEYNNAFLGAFFRRYLLRENPDVVHFFHLFRLSAAVVDICYELGIKMVFTPTDFWSICPVYQLRLPNNKMCSGPNELGTNCIRHKVELIQYPVLRTIVRLMPNPLIKMLTLLPNNIPFINKYSQMLKALTNRKKFLISKINLIDQVIVPTQIMKSILSENGLNPHRTKLIPFGLNLSYIKHLPRPNPESILRLGYIGTVNEPKGLHILLKAIRLLIEEPLELKIYGNLEEFPEYVDSLYAIIEDDPRVKFCGTFPNNEIGIILSDLDVLVVPSLWHENSPLVVYSAQAAACPIIASNVAGISQFVTHEKNGFLFEPGDVKGLVEIIRILLGDRTLLQKLSNNSPRPLSIEEYVLKLIDIYHNLVHDVASV
jgi:glycosyltransferase involved in cell wall biosynthesis